MSAGRFYGRKGRGVTRPRRIEFSTPPSATQTDILDYDPKVLAKNTNLTPRRVTYLMEHDVLDAERQEVEERERDSGDGNFSFSDISGLDSDADPEYVPPLGVGLDETGALEISAVPVVAEASGLAGDGVTGEEGVHGEGVPSTSGRGARARSEGDVSMGGRVLLIRLLGQGCMGEGGEVGRV